MKFSHVSMVARNTDRLADFYKTVFGCKDSSSRKTMSGELLSRGNGVPNAEVYAAWLSLPCVDGPFLEIFEYKNCNDHSTPPVNQPGYGHISFEVEDIQATFNAVIKAGGTPLGEITDFGTAKVPFLYVYVRDLRGKRCRTGAALGIVSRHEDCFWSWLYENVRSETAHRKFIPHIGN